MFAERLRFLRKKKKLSQVVLAERLGVANGTVAMWELGKREPDMKMCSRIADFFGVSIDYLVGRTDEPTYIATTTFDDGLVLEAESTTKEPPTLEERERLETAIKGGLYSTGPILPDDELEKRIEAVLRRMLADEKGNENKDL